MESLARTSVHGIFWTLLRVVGQTGISFGVGILLARLLDIEAFGLMAIAMIFIGFSELVSTLGVEGALIQRNEVTPQHLEAALMLSLLTATSLLAIFILCSGLAADFFQQPELTRMLPVLGLGQWFATMAMVPRAILRRRFEFKLLSKIELGAYLFGYALLSVTLALAGLGVWSLVIGTSVGFLISSSLLFYCARPPLRLTWQGKEMGDLLNFGMMLTGKYVLNYVANQSSNLLIGRFLGAYPLGLFSRAAQIANLPLQKIAYAFSSVMFPIYASIQQDVGRVAAVYLRTVAGVTLLSAPPLAVAAVAAEIVVGGLYGEKWLPAAPIFAALALASIFNCILHLAGALVEASNRILDELKRQSLYFILTIAGFAWASQKNIVVVAEVALAGSIILYLMMSHLVLRILNTRWRPYLSAQLPGILVAGLLAGGTHLVLPWLNTSGWAYPMRLLILGLIAAPCYLLALAVLPDRWLFGAKAMILARYLKRTPAQPAA